MSTEMYFLSNGTEELKDEYCFGYFSGSKDTRQFIWTTHTEVAVKRMHDEGAVIRCWGAEVISLKEFETELRSCKLQRMHQHRGIVITG